MKLKRRRRTHTSAKISKTGTLTEQEARFVTHYCTAFNGTEAYCKAYDEVNRIKAGSYACRVLARPHVLEAIRQEMEVQRAVIKHDAQSIIDELYCIAKTNIQDFYRPDGSFMGIKEIPEKMARAIAGIEFEEIWGYSECTTDETDEKGKPKKYKHHIGRIIKIRLWDKPKGLELLGRNLAMFIDRTEMSGAGGAPIVPPEVIVQALPSPHEQEPPAKAA